MPVMDEFREEREALKHGTPKEKLSYFMYYYKWHVIVAVCVIIAVSVLANQILTRKDTVFYAAMINGVDTLSLDPKDDPFYQYSGIDADKSAVVYDTSMLIDINSTNEISISSAQKFVVFLAAAQMDVVISGENVIQKYAHNGTFYDLTKFLTEEQIKEYVPEYPDPRHPENMKQPVPVGIYVTDCPNLTDRFIFADSNSGIILSVMSNTTRPEMVSKYIDFLMKAQNDSPHT